jgi:hypothetical protein
MQKKHIEMGMLMMPKKSEFAVYILKPSIACEGDDDDFIQKLISHSNVFTVRFASPYLHRMEFHSPRLPPTKTHIACAGSFKFMLRLPLRNESERLRNLNQKKSHHSHPHVDKPESSAQLNWPFYVGKASKCGETK